MWNQSRVLYLAAGPVLLLVAMTTPVRGVEPGVDIAAPRVAITQAGLNFGLTFTPAVVRVERGDHVRWRWVSGSHSTTSGSPCAASGLWNSALTGNVTVFTRQFFEAPGTIPYFCSPHCGVMTGQVMVTSPIETALTDTSGMVDLAWSGGVAPYRVYRSDSPLFGAGTQILSPPGGVSATGFTDASGVTPAVDKVFYYLVMNQF
jgi:plastocyanin